MAVFSLKIAPKHDTKNRYPSISTITAEMGGFSMIGGTMPRMSKKRKLELSFFLNDRGRVAYNDLCRKCQHECKQSFRAVVIDCPHYLSKRAKRKEKTDYAALTLTTSSTVTAASVRKSADRVIMTRFFIFIFIKPPAKDCFCKYP